MRNFQNKKFIKTRISTLLSREIDCVSSFSNMIEFYPISEMILQSLFLKLTGAQEQKFKSMLWEWACMDLDYRRYLLKNSRSNDTKDNNYINYPEIKNYSAYCEKNDFIKKMYKVISDVINKDEKCFLCDDDGQRLNEKFIMISRNDIENIFMSSFYNRMNVFINYWDPNVGFINNNELELIVKQVATNNEEKSLLVFNDKFVENCYKKLYKYRNKCAHNAFVYQNPYPTLDELSKMDENNNIFKWIQTLLIIDELSIYFFEILENL
ncbi:MAG: hypothetical protein IJ593_04205 [Lachnospiraceae bacterium]|nr:hypothetical protein [Lachnospiraceae bacterium]